MASKKLKKKTKKKQKVPVNKIQKMLAFCREVITTIQKENGLSDYRIKLQYDDYGPNDSHTVLADITVDDEYIRATVTIRPEFEEMYRDKRYNELIEALCHEVFHIRLSKIDDLANARWGTPAAIRTEIERLTEFYGRMMYKVMSVENKFDNLKTLNGTTKRKKSK